MSKKIYLYILKTGIYLSLLSVFLVYNKFLFPYITSKQIYFNILIEILFVFWVTFILKYPEYRPKKNWISFGLVGFFAVMLLTCFTGVDFNLSFWGDVERMLGFFHIVHFLIFYFIIITVMRDWRDWKVFFILSIICACVVSFYSINKINFSTIGNTAYVSGYLIFNIYFALLLFFDSYKKANFKLSEHWFVNLLPSLLYLLPIPVMLVAFKKTNTSGAQVGLAISIFVLLFLFGVFSQNKKIKQYMFASILILVLAVSFLFLNKDSDFLQGTHLRGVLKDISSEKTTFQTRLISWKAALYDFKNHPMLGTGHGNYAITFDKHFDPSFYNYDRNATYFDRAHNNLIGIVSTTGLLGLLTYLSIFIAVGVYLLRGFFDNKINLLEFALISALIVAYFIQNLAVFDSLATYMMLMMALGFVGHKLKVDSQKSKVDEVENRFSSQREIYTLVGVGFVILLVIYQYNIKPIKMLKGTIAGQIAFAQGNTLGGVEEYKKALSYDTGLDRDSRASIIRLILSKQNLLRALDKEQAKEVLDYLIELAEKNVAYNPQDSLMQMQLTQVLSIALGFASSNNELAGYIERAHQSIDASIEASPGRIRLYYTKAQIHLTVGEIDNAIKLLEYAASLNESYYDSHCHLTRIYASANKPEKSYEAADKCLEFGGARLLQADLVGQLVNYYNTPGNAKSPEISLRRLISLFERSSQLEPQNAKILVNLAQLYMKAGNNVKAIQSAEKAAGIDVSLRSAVDEFIGGLK